MSHHRSQPWHLPKRAVAAAGGIVASQSLRAAQLGARVLAAGGNAVDAAVVTGFAVGVAEPWMSGLGGGGYMLVRPAGEPFAQVVDFGMVAPRGLDPADYPLAGSAEDRAADLFDWPRVVGDRNLKGAASVAVPGQVDGMRLALERFGSIAWRDALAPAIALAEEGLAVDWFTALGIAVAARELAEFEAARAVFLPDGLPPTPGPDGAPRRLPLGRLAHTLRRLAEAGGRDFYEGAIAESIVREVRAAGGCLDHADLKAYRATIRPALEIPYRGLTVSAAPGLTAGPTLARVLNRLEAALPIGREPDVPDAAAYRTYAEVLHDAYTERFATMGHANETASPSCTTHISVVDSAGTMVALTQTLLSRFGSKLLLPETGILMNNGIMWFDPQPGRPNSLAPGRRPLSNMCPVIVGRRAEDGAEEAAPWLALGASGGRRILPAVAQILSFLVDFRLPLEAAFHQPRLDASGEPAVTVDDRLPEAVFEAVAAALPARRGALSVYPVLFASPNAVLREAGRNAGMADIASPWSGAVAADAAGKSGLTSDLSTEDCRSRRMTRPPA